MLAELDAYKAAEVRLKERLADKDARIHELTHKTFYLNDELNGAHDRQVCVCACVYMCLFVCLCVCVCVCERERERKRERERERESVCV